jgi:hypothetical protein
MMTFPRWTYTILTALVLCLASVQPAGATAFAGVDKAFWLVSINDPLSALNVGYQVTSITSSRQSSEAGFAETDFQTNITNDAASHLLIQDGFGRSIVQGAGSAATILDVLGVINITNTTALPIEFTPPSFTSVSSFNPGGSEIGASVDNPQSESALFSSAVSLIGPLVVAQDHHGCETNLLMIACGVTAPDSSEGDIFGVLGPFQTILIDTLLHIETQARVLPEPASLSLVGLGLMGLIVVSRPRRIWPRSRRSAHLAS